MKGHVRERSPGHWSAVLEQRDPITGKRKRKWIALPAATGKRQAQIECAKLISDLSRGTYIEPNKITVGEYLDRWIEHIKTQVSPKTFERYSGIVTRNLKPQIGSDALLKLKPARISAAYTAALQTGRHDGEGGLSPRTVGHMHRVLKQALQQAVRWEVIHRNPVDAVRPPKLDWKPMQTYDLPATVEVIEVARGTPLLMPVLLAVLCGLRQGEICALRWRHIDFAAAQLSVAESLEQTKAGLRFKAPKSGKARTVALSGTMVEELRSHRAQRAEELLKLGQGLSEDDLVLGHPDGSLVKPIYVSQHWARLIRKTSLPHLRFHDLRHAHATHLLANGVHPKVASERLGHSKVGITLDLYSHVIPGMQDRAAAIVDDALKAARAGRSVTEVAALPEMLPNRK